MTVNETLETILQQHQAAQAAANAAHERYQATGYTMALEKQRNKVAIGDYLYNSPAAAAHEIATKELEAANAQVNRLAAACAILRAAV